MAGFFLQRMSEMEPKPLKWVWDGLIPMGKLTLLRGNPGAGKSLLALQVASMVTRGLTTPPNSPQSVETSKSDSETGSPPRTVIVISSELAAEEKLKFGLNAAGADVSKVFALTVRGCQAWAGRADGSWITPENSAEDVSSQLCQNLPTLKMRLRQLLKAKGDAGLIVIDSIDTCTNPLDKKNDRFELVAQLADLAMTSGAAVLAIANSTLGARSRSDRDLEQQLVSSARSVLKIGQFMEDEHQRILLPVKMNLAAIRPGIPFTLRNGVISWGQKGK
jgi:putative DNA primase/helicase